MKQLTSGSHVTTVHHDGFKHYFTCAAGDVTHTDNAFDTPTEAEVAADGKAGLGFGACGSGRARRSGTAGGASLYISSSNDISSSDEGTGAGFGAVAGRSLQEPGRGRAPRR